MKKSSNIKKYIIQPKNLTRWIVVGKRKEYTITRNSCTCQSFLTVMKKEDNKCKHIKELENAIKENNFDVYDISIQEFRKIRDFLFGFKN